MKKLNLCLFLSLSLFFARAGHASVVLDGAHLLDQDSSGNYVAGGDIWSTTGCCAPAQLGTGTDLSNASYINTGAGDLNYTVPDGTTHFILVAGSTGYSPSNLGVDLYFNLTNATMAPQISADANGGTTGNQPSYDYSNWSLPGGGLVSTFGSQVVTLSNLVWTPEAGGNPNYVTFDLTLAGSGGSSAAPEPASLALLGGGLFVCLAISKLRSLQH
jgi:hypothetical protein